MANRLIHRPLDRDLYDRLAPRVSLPWLPEDWRTFRVQLRRDLPPSPPLTEADQLDLLRAGISVRNAAEGLWEEGGNPSVNSDAVTLLLGATICSLGHWAARFPRSGNGGGILARLRCYLVDDMKGFRAVFGETVEKGAAKFQSDDESRDLLFVHDGMESRLTYDEAILVGFLWWILVTEWCWNNIDMD